MPEVEAFSPLVLAKHKDMSDDLNLDRQAKQRDIGLGKQPSGRQLKAFASPTLLPLVPESKHDAANEHEEHATPRRRTHGFSEALSQINAWVHEEKDRRQARRAKRKSARSISKSAEREGTGPPTDGDNPSSHSSRRGSDDSTGSMALERLEAILQQSRIPVDEKPTRKKSVTQVVRRPSSFRKLRTQSTAASSEVDLGDLDSIVPSCHAVLDNSNTLSYVGGSAADKEGSKESEAWATFKFEIVRLAHTLRLKGWRQVAMEQSRHIDVERLSGALTNAVYVVSPPKVIASGKDESNSEMMYKKSPPKLLLRIYGPQVEHLIDRKVELQILKRLARKRIGPRMLGTFDNGRFEEFFHARTLTAQDLRVPDTSVQIAKRMRELHTGIELLEQELDNGPFVWKNWDSWVDRSGRIVSFLDKQSAQNGQVFLCGVKWPLFRKTVEKYREWLDDYYGGREQVRNQLVFAHNDTQYGNILRLEPPGESPLLLPANEHRRLVVIDFEYANANTPAQEFANHFTEWCYNYHNPQQSWACNTTHYPSIEEQQRFFRAYIQHVPHFASNPFDSTPQTPVSGPIDDARPALSSSFSSFSLDSFYSASRHRNAEIAEAAELDNKIRRLMYETRLWRVVNSAHWVAWGVVQAHIPGMPMDAGHDEHAAEGLAPGQGSDPLDAEGAAAVKDLAEKRPEEAGADDGGFDYLSYARDRALFFWGDVLQLGIVDEKDLPQELVSRVKVVAH